MVRNWKRQGISDSVPDVSGEGREVLDRIA